MIAYLDSSVLLRVVLGQRDKFKEWRAVREGVASALVEVECVRTLDRLRLRGAMTDRQLSSRREAIYRLLERTGAVLAQRPVLGVRNDLVVARHPADVTERAERLARPCLLRLCHAFTSSPADAAFRAEIRSQTIAPLVVSPKCTIEVQRSSL